MMKSIVVCAGLVVLFAACTVQTTGTAKGGGASCTSNDQCESGVCQGASASGGTCTAGTGTNGGDAPSVVPACVADELDSTTTASSLFDVKPGEVKSVSIGISGGQLKTFDGMECKFHPLAVAPKYPGCNQGFDCGPCYCQLDVPGFGKNMWTVTCRDNVTNGTACPKYQNIKYEIAPWVAPTTGGSSGSSGSSGTSCGVCRDCYDECNTSCDGYPGNCSTTCQASCDKCCTRN